MNFHRLLTIAGLCVAASAPLFAQDATPTPVPEGSPVAAAPGASPVPKFSWGSVHVDGPYIALTFDDGPSATLTPQLLKVLESRHIHATFFLIGEHVQAHPEIVKQEIADGDEVGNHTWDHPNLGILPDDKVRSELKLTDDAIYNAIGVHPKMLRPPYGSLAHAQRLWINKEFGYRIIFWNIDPLDWKDPGADVVASRILDAVKPGSIILSHDIHAGTVEAMPHIIDTLLAKGYKFVTVPELIALSTPVPPAPAASATAKSKAIPSLAPGMVPATPIFQ